MPKTAYYRLDNILSKNALYNIIIGERSNGKSYAALELILKNAAREGEQGAIVRRWLTDFQGKRGAVMFDSLVSNGIVSRETGGRWNSVYYYSARWYFCLIENGKRVETADEPFCYAFSLASMEHDKSTSYPQITTVVFDEFITRNRYLDSEFVLFMHVLSTIIRDRNNVKIFMLGNTVNQTCPYFAEMGLINIKRMKPGDIDTYVYGESGRLRVAVEFCGDKQKRTKKDSDVYFAFDNPRLNVITGSGDIWEMAIYPHCPVRYRPKDVLWNFFIQFDGNTLHGEVVGIDGNFFVFLHRKTTPLLEDGNDIIFTPDHDHRANRRRNMLKPVYPVEKRLYSLFIQDKFFFQDNSVGEVFRNYIQWCRGAELI